MENGFRDRAAIVTGGASGIGRAVSEALGAAGANVLLSWYESEAGAAETVAAFLAGETIEVNGGQGLF